VTGASSGIGRELARTLHRQGLNVAISGRSEQALAQLDQELRQTAGPLPVRPPQIRTILLDLSRPGASRDLIDQVGDLDIGLAAWSAGYGSGGEFLSGDVDSESSMVDVNCRAVVELTHRVLPRLTPRGRGGLIFF
jgi:short-subunit dehydrogenase